MSGGYCGRALAAIALEAAPVLRKHLADDSCIASTAVVLELCGALGIAAAPLPVEFMILNAPAFAAARAGLGPDDVPGAFAVGCSSAAPDRPPYTWSDPPRRPGRAALAHRHDAAAGGAP